MCACEPFYRRAQRIGHDSHVLHQSTERLVQVVFPLAKAYASELTGTEMLGRLTSDVKGRENVHCALRVHQKHVPWSAKWTSAFRCEADELSTCASRGDWRTITRGTSVVTFF